MNPENLHDAMNLLDEELLTPVVQLRKGKKVRWGHMAALAACLAVVCALGLSNAGLFDSVENSGHAVVKDDLLDSEAVEALPEDRNDDIRDQSSTVVESKENDVNKPLPTAVLVIDAWHAEGFTATSRSADSVLTPGGCVTVILTEDTLVCMGAGDEGHRWKRGETPFEVGTAVKMQYTAGEEPATVYACILSPSE